MAGSDPAHHRKVRMIREGKLHVEKSPEEALHEIDLSEAIDPDEVTTTVQQGTSEIQMKKAGPGKNIAATVEAVKATTRAPASTATPWKGSGPNHEIAD